MKEQIHWTEIFGNPLRFGLHPAMLTERGYRLKTVVPIKGESKKDKFPVEVLFDESYVIAHLSRILEQLQPQKYNDFQAVVSKAYAHWNEKKKNNKE
ncbi:hypothetical protein I8751_13660 [Nostocaceae cyanobacterium CENA357]|uniref:Uncharacterized protein n=1 Tax=Atlanticothrix silvestris CENA357 TaxID=1725252 RepID=A0A8J7L5T0_9CYAN|nr:hypothetical protein [Atlanticothrix silvestris]MBH8553402.1 hypothetical protein [Atlanticothrix silvestris CENA357]